MKYPSCFTNVRDRCSHCRKLAPTWKALAEFHKDNSEITIAKVLYGAK